MERRLQSRPRPKSSKRNFICWKMKVIFTRHAEEKLKRRDIKNLKISKVKIRKILNDPRSKSKTKYGNFAVVDQIDQEHDVRIIYDIIEVGIKVITFHIARKQRYK